MARTGAHAAATLMAVVLAASSVGEACAARIRGVVRGDWGMLLSGATVTLLDPLTQATMEVTTVGGQYEFTVSPGVYSLTVLPPQPAYYDMTVGGANVGEFDDEVYRDFDLMVIRGDVFGVVRFEDGKALGNVRVQLSHRANPNYALEGLTAIDGTFRFTVPTDVYMINVLSPPPVPGWTAGGIQHPGQFVRFGYWGVQPDFLLQHVENYFELVLPYFAGAVTVRDANGVGIPNVRIEGMKVLGACQNQSESCESSMEGRGPLTNASGVAPYWGPPGEHMLNLLPGAGSGFLPLNMPPVSFNTSGMLLQGALEFGDGDAPVILSAPAVRDVGATRAVVEWVTDEPASGSVVVNGNTFTHAGLLTLHSVVITGLSPSTDHVATVASRDASNNGPRTAALTFTTRASDDLAPPVFLDGPVVTGVTHAGAIVEWATNEPAAARVDYGTTPALGSTTLNANLQVRHRVAIAGLAASTGYRVRAGATDAAGNGPAQSALLEFTTRPLPDSRPPVIVGKALARDVTTTAATITWQTDEPATSGASWNDGTAHGLVSDPALVTVHSVRMTGLQPGTSYLVTAASKDEAGNGPSISTVALTTLPAVDVAPPVITCQPGAQSIKMRSAVITWCTGEEADSRVTFGTSPASLTERVSGTIPTLTHRVNLVGLASGTTYHYTVESRDAAGNRSAPLPTVQFTTPAASLPLAFEEPPAILYKGDKQVTVEWVTDAMADALLECTSPTAGTQRVTRAERLMKHQLTLGNLDPGATYTCRVKSIDIEGNAVEQ